MLISFRCRNFRSFHDEAELSMRATSDTELSELNTFKINDGIAGKNNNEFIKSAIIFGSNASGKTNILRAIKYMQLAVMLSFDQNRLKVIANNEPFALEDDSDKKPTIFEVEFVQNNIYYKYGFELLEGKISSEYLKKREERISPVFERTGNTLRISKTPEQTTNLIKLSDTVLFLTAESNYNLPVSQYLHDAYTWFTELRIVFENNKNALDIYTIKDGKYKKLALEILKKADIGISDFEVIKNKISDDDISRIPEPRSAFGGTARMIKHENDSDYEIDIKTKFDIRDKNDNIVGTKTAMLLKDSGFNSEGTVRLIFYLGWILEALDEGRTILIDEIDSKLHFLVADYLIGIFNSIDRNPNNAQLICTAHNVMLMDEDLRRDQIYFTCKDSMGRSSIISLADYKGVRKNDLFSKKYLAGFFTDLPDLGISN